MEKLLTKALMEFKENHKNDTDIDMKELNELIEKSEKGYLTRPYLTMAFYELESHVESREQDAEYGDEQAKAIVDLYKEKKDELIERVYDEIQSDDHVWEHVWRDIEDVLSEYIDIDAEEDA